MIGAWIGLFGWLAMLRQNNFGSFSLDMGIFDQATWLLSRMHGLFMTVRGLHFFGHHANFGLFVLAPFYWFGAGPNFLNLAMVTSMALGALPLYLLGRDLLENRWLPLLPAAAYLLHPSLQFMSWELFHPEVMAITPLLFAWWMARRQRWWWVAGFLVYAVSWKEDVALAAFVFGVIFAARRARRPGLLIAGTSLVYFLIVNNWMIPTFSGVGKAFYNSLYGPLGDSLAQVFANGIRHPTLILRPLLHDKDTHTFAWKMLASFGFVPIAAPLPLAIGVPQTAADVLSTANFTRMIYYHYAAIPLAALSLGAVHGLAAFKRSRLALGAVGVLLVAGSLIGTTKWGPSPVGHEYHKGWWPLNIDPSLQAAREAAIRVPPHDAHISATYNLLPHMSRRRYAYSFPNPWISDNWAVHGEHLPSPNVVHWLVVDRRLLSNANAALISYVISRGEFKVVFDSNDVFVAKRIAKGSRITPEQQLAWSKL